MRLVTLPGVFRPLGDSRLLLASMRRELVPGALVADVCCGSGLLAVTAALDGTVVTAIDVSRRALVTTRLNARLNGADVRALRGDLLAPCAGERFDVIVSNPPYVPTATNARPAVAARAWSGGRDGRLLLDRLCDEAPQHLRPGGVLLVVHSHVCREQLTLDRLSAGGLSAQVVQRSRGPFGPLLGGRAEQLERQGLLRPEETEEELVVIRARRPAGDFPE